MEFPMFSIIHQKGTFVKCDNWPKKQKPQLAAAALAKEGHVLTREVCHMERALSILFHW